MLETGFSPWPSFTPEEIAATGAVLASNRVNYWTGNVCRAFEREFAAWLDVPHAVALANGTLALDVALKALDIGPGDEVVVTPRTFLASASSIVLAGATPIFADVDPDSQNITADTIGAVLTPRTKAVICVHLAGWPCDMDPIMVLARKHGLAVIEDCAQAHGAVYKGRAVGTIGDIGAWSFCQDKIMTTGGEGGMVTTHRRDLWERMWSYKDHGKSWEAVYERKHPVGFRWVHESFGTNWRMLEMQAAIGRIQLTRMPEWSRRRQANASVLAQALSTCASVRVPWPSSDITHAWYKFYAFVEPQQLAPGWTRDRILAEINAAGVPCYAGTCSEVYLEKAFEPTGWRPERRLPVAQRLGETSLMWLVHPTLTEAEMARMAEVSRAVLTMAARRAAA
ncbi:DegT/DnrJ/EryC1/StrS family aminotransferase [Ralstonia solanacearum]|uniref:DegT/DnrJ/EryC1/StrS family aminotransferase n=1 Tax=Ralstonia solanacearum TaxID=305 RepID=UPI0007C8FA32|nr:DegT/DnrJ/EryC1/StrS aminotransferase family protein [Ralstonia solanacearum]ATJ88664.1 aminotransferase [Ralstonia solanacearum]AYB54102.1 DegT/DnrJ/EryC1/StrS aminotransferase family protein [Ralstonia solanacearum]AYB58655.1 DegT/DnrJ/EryC1/StrS aminotransferase family protein [Ralstonia solanacearum]OAI63501.1 aminotransferase [Ralstonia solanacearum]RCW07931.1 aminotransferase [Ralstonia solanacearum]